MDLSQTIKAKAIEIGFDLAAVTSADPIEPDQIRHLQNWLQKGYSAKLQYMTRNLEKRINPARLLPGARSVICVALNYRPVQSCRQQSCAKIANYALYEDYHGFIKQRLIRLAYFIQSRLPEDASFKFKACVDTAPLAERALAARCGLGVIGRNHMLIHPKLGSQILLGELITTLPLTFDPPLKIDLCRDCDLCARACPTGALQRDGFLDTRRCISYLTQYENDPGPYSRAIGDRLYGCDTCIAACPAEKNTPACENTQFRFFPQRLDPDPQAIGSWTPSAFMEHFQNSCLEPIGLEKLKHNAEICLKNKT